MPDVLEANPEGRAVLVVDDSRSMRMFITKTLEDAGYSCDQAEDGNQGLLKCLKHRYQLVLSDYDMPGVNGMNFVTRLRAAEKTRDIPIIMITARGDAESVREAVKVGLNGYIVKPFQAPQLLAKVRSLLPLRPGPTA